MRWWNALGVNRSAALHDVYRVHQNLRPHVNDRHSHDRAMTHAVLDAGRQYYMPGDPAVFETAGLAARAENQLRPRLRLVRVRGDGHCFFRAIVQSAHNGTLSQSRETEIAASLRRKIARHILAMSLNPDYRVAFQSYYGHDPVTLAKHVEKWCEAPRWAEDLEIQITAEILRVPVIVYRGSQIAQAFAPKNWTPSTPIIRISHSGNTETGHYDALV